MSFIISVSHCFPYLSSNQLLWCRSKEKVERTVAAIQQQTGNTHVSGYTADLSSLASVADLAAAVKKDHASIYALVNNAGVYEKQKRWVCTARHCHIGQSTFLLLLSLHSRR